MSILNLTNSRASVGALERLRFAVDLRDPALLVAPPGTGKSVLLEALCSELPASAVQVIATQLTACGPFGLVGQLATSYRTPLRRTTAQTAAALLDELGRSPRTELLILDEAHRLPDTACWASSTSIGAPPSRCSWPASPCSTSACSSPTSSRSPIRRSELQIRPALPGWIRRGRAATSGGSV